MCEASYSNTNRGSAQRDGWNSTHVDSGMPWYRIQTCSNREHSCRMLTISGPRSFLKVSNHASRLPWLPQYAP